MLKRITADEARLGMYVRRFHGSFFKHPFWWARFVVRTERQLARIRDAGLDISIDVSKGADVAVAPPVADKAPVVAAATPAPAGPLAPAADVLPFTPSTRPVRRIVAPAAFGKADKARAQALAQRSTTAVRSMFEDHRRGAPLQTGQIISVVDDITVTLEQNSAAFLNVTRLKTKDAAVYTHSIAVCALMVGLGREAGLTAGEVQALGTAGLLHDIGKVQIDDRLLQKEGLLTASEIHEIQRHAELGHAILSNEKNLSAIVLDVCLNHHERVNGSGYPAQRVWKNLSPAARMAAICDSYEAMTSTGRTDGAMTPIEAITDLHGDAAYDDALLFKFMRSIGVFPERILVRLRSNRLGVVLPSAGEDCRPVVRAFYSTVGTSFIDYEDAVLSEALKDDQAVSEEDPTLWFPGNWPDMRAHILDGRPLTLAHTGGSRVRASAR